MPTEPRAATAAPTHHPSSVPYDPDLALRLTNALSAAGPNYRPRTRHYDGSEHRSEARHPDPAAPAGAKPTYTNRLLLEPSPYLRQHAHNPVDWRPWGADAFAEARRLGRPIFLSVGYATCHWCHVMEHESFEDLEIAALLNSRYVPVKVDREERPDVDAIYMAAVQAMSGNGGWPMSVWIAPGPGGAGKEVAGLPFFAGTYFPPRGGVGRRPGFADILTKLADNWAEDAAGIARKGEQVAAHIQAQMAADWHGAMPTTAPIDRLAAQLVANFDPIDGGTQRAPKFPSNIPVALLLRQAARTQNAQSRHVALFSLQKMSMGGIYDHVGGGFARYSTDRHWLVPHFEKMLYDQALIGRALVAALVDGAVATQTPATSAGFARTLRQTMDYLLREMAAPWGGFYSATDADSEGEEGRFFLWTPAQLRAALTPDEATLIAEVYDVSENGNFEGRNILHLSKSLEEHADARKVERGAFVAQVYAALAKLYTVRSERIPPLRDDKVLTSWNGLLIGTLAQASFQLDEPRYLRAAVRAAEFVTTALRDAQGRQLRVAIGDPEHGGSARVRAQLDDLAFLIGGLLDVFEASGDPQWLRRALQLQAQLDADFTDPRGGYFATAKDADALLAREKPDYDGAEPSGNAIAAQNLLRLGAMTGDTMWTQRGEATIAAFSRRIEQAPMAMTELLLALEMAHAPLRELVLVGAEGCDDAAFAPFLQALRTSGQPNRVLLRTRQGPELQRLGEIAPLVREKVARGGKVTAYVCVRGVCKLPTTEPAQMVASLRSPANGSK